MKCPQLNEEICITKGWYKLYKFLEEQEKRKEEEKCTTDIKQLDIHKVE